MNGDIKIRDHESFSEFFMHMELSTQMDQRATTAPKDDIEQFVILYQRGKQSLWELGAFTARAIDADATFIQRLRKEHPDLPVQLIRTFEKIGRKRIHPEVYLEESRPWARALKKLPFDLQEKYLREPFPLLVPAGDGDWTTLLVDVRNMNEEQRKQAFGPNGAREDEGEQRAFIESQKQAEALNVTAPPVEIPYRILDGKCIILKPCTLSAHDLKRMIKELNQ